jgi:hypothetical protein
MYVAHSSGYRAVLSARVAPDRGAPVLLQALTEMAQRRANCDCQGGVIKLIGTREDPVTMGVESVAVS